MCLRNDVSMPTLRGLVVIFLIMQSSSATAADTGAQTSGNWSSAATWTNGLPGATDRAYIGGTYPNGAAANATVTLTQNSIAHAVALGVGYETSGTLDLGGYNLNATTVSVGVGTGSVGTILRTGGGTLSVSDTMVLQNTSAFTFSPDDGVGGLWLYSGSTAATVSAGNATHDVLIESGATLMLGANLSLRDSIDVGGILNANGRTISALNVTLGSNRGPYMLTNRGPIVAAGILTVSSKFSPSPTTFSVTAADSINNLQLNGVSTTLPPDVWVPFLNLASNGVLPPTYAAATTTSVGNVTGIADIAAGCTLTLGADLSLTYDLHLSGTLNANGHAVSGRNIYFGYFGGPATLQNDGPVTATVWKQGHGTQFQMHQPGDALGTVLLTGNSALTVLDAAGQTSGLTLGNVLVNDLTIDPGSDLMLEVNGLASGWVFRWANPSGGDHIADMQALINGGEITFSYLNGGSYSLSADSSYTYVNVIPVPEPSTLLLSAAAAGLIAVRRRKKK